jgi:hypothetical protein
MHNNNMSNTNTPTTETKQPQTLTCQVTGKSRPSSIEYLQDKATRLSAKLDRTISVADIKANYVSRDGLKSLKDGTSTLDAKKIAELLAFNGKSGASVAVTA